MSYFNNFPYINYQFPDNTKRLFKDLSIRPAFIEKVLEEDSNFEFYSVKDGETPEIISYNVYGDVNYHWVIMLANNVLNLYTDWPKTHNQLDNWLMVNYRRPLNIKTNQPIKSNLNDSDTRALLEFKGNPTNKFNIIKKHITGNDSEQYRINPQYLVLNKVNYHYTDSDARIKGAVPESIYEHHERLNEGKRDIRILKFQVVEQVERELRKLIHG